jgi:putative oxidoreductase
MAIGLVLLGLTVGFTLAAHGAQKLFGWVGGPRLDAIGLFFAMLGSHSGWRLLSWLEVTSTNSRLFVQVKLCR